jgi:phosphoglycolate phosphatase
MLLAVASNKFQEGTEHLIKEFFPEIPFVAILGSRPDFPLKPSPEIVGEVLKKSGVQREEAVMVGDSETDMETAANGGIEGIAVSWGYRNMKDLADKWSALRQAQGPQVVVSAEELQKLLLP